MPDGIENISPAAPPAPAPGHRITREQLADVFENVFRITAFGIAATHPGAPADFLWDAIANAMGNVISGATQGPDIKATIEARGRLGDIFNQAVRKKYPAITSPASEMIKVAHAR